MNERVTQIVEQMLDGIIDECRPGTLDTERPALRLMLRKYGKTLIQIMIEMKSKGINPFEIVEVGVLLKSNGR